MVLTAYVIISYLIGSIPVGFILVYICTGKNLKHHGSGNIGVTNVLRVSNKILAFFTLVIDFAKGFLVTVIYKYYGIEIWLILGLVVVFGYMFPIWLKFSGGKGVATSLGLLLAVNPYLFIITVTIWLVIVFLFRISSLSAIVTFLLLPINCALLHMDTYKVILLTILSIIIILKHKSNIIRLINKQEDKINLFKNG